MERLRTYQVVQHELRGEADAKALIVRDVCLLELPEDCSGSSALKTTRRSEITHELLHCAVVWLDWDNNTEGLCKN
jgi:hypothetical protein